MCTSGERSWCLRRAWLLGALRSACGAMQAGRSERLRRRARASAADTPGENVTLSVCQLDGRRGGRAVSENQFDKLPPPGKVPTHASNPPHLPPPASSALSRSLPISLCLTPLYPSSSSSSPSPTTSSSASTTSSGVIDPRRTPSLSHTHARTHTHWGKASHRASH